MSRTLGVAALQLAPVPHDVEATWAKAEALIREVASTWDWVDVVQLPELYLHAEASFDPAAPAGWLEAVAEPVPGPTTDRLGALAAELGVWLVPGSLYERDGGRVYNTTPVISAAGEVAAVYRKLFPWRPYERTAAGEEPCVLEIPRRGRIGVCICYDLWFPEVARALFAEGAEAIFHPSLTATWDRGLEVVLARATAVANQLYFLDRNCAGGVGGGRSVFVGPEGDVLHEAGPGEEVFGRILDLDAVARVRETGTLGLNRLRDELARARSLNAPRASA
jgi:formamidase